MDPFAYWEQFGTPLPPEQVESALRHPKILKLVESVTWTYIYGKRLWLPRRSSDELWDEVHALLRVSMLDALQKYRPLRKSPEHPNGGKSFVAFYKQVAKLDVANWLDQQSRIEGTGKYAPRHAPMSTLSYHHDWDPKSNKDATGPAGAFDDDDVTAEAQLIAGANALPGWTSGLLADDAADERAAEADMDLATEWDNDTEARWGRYGKAAHEPLSKASRSRWKVRVAKDQAAAAVRVPARVAADKVLTWYRLHEWVNAADYTSAVEGQRAQGVDLSLDKMMRKEEDDSEATGSD